MGPKDLENGTVEIARRDNGTKETVPFEGIADRIQQLMIDIQDNLFAQAMGYREEHITRVDSYEDFKKQLDDKGGFFLAHWDGTKETEERVKDETKATIRCIPFGMGEEEGVCMVSGKPSKQRVLFARAY
jgi:prolyl-tRNA synthetase